MRYGKVSKSVKEIIYSPESVILNVFPAYV